MAYSEAWPSFTRSCQSTSHEGQVALKLSSTMKLDHSRTVRQTFSWIMHKKVRATLLSVNSLKLMCSPTVLELKAIALEMG